LIVSPAADSIAANNRFDAAIKKVLTNGDSDVFTPTPKKTPTASQATRTPTSPTACGVVAAWSPTTTVR